MLQRAILLLLLAACPQKAPPPPPQSCLDVELAKRGLNQFGDPPDTMYPGGTPLFDERTGERKGREDYVFARHPDIATACRGK